MKRCISIIMIVFMVLTNIFTNSEAVFAAPTAPNITVINNLAGKSDTIYVYGLDSGDLVKVYDKDGNVIAYATVPKNKIDITFKIAQLGTEAGSVYVSVVSNKGGGESSKTEASYKEEPKSVKLKPENVTIINNAQKADIITVSGLNARDVVKVYTEAGVLLGNKTASSSGNNAIISVAQLGSGEGSVYITVTSKNMGESEKSAPITYSAEPPSNAPSSADVYVNNNAKKADSVVVSGLNGGDVVKVYNAATDGKLLGSKKASALGYEVTIPISQIRTKDGYIYVSITSSDCAESVRTKVDYLDELQSAELNPKYIIVTNNSGKPDTVYVTGLSAKDVIKVYTDSSQRSLLGTATASATGGDATVSIAQLPTIQPGVKFGYVYVSVTSTDMNESGRVEATYEVEGVTGSISSDNVIITNNVGKADTVYVSNLIEGDTIRIYDTLTGGKLLASSTVTASKFDTTISISQLKTEGGSIYVSVANSGKIESSPRTPVAYAKEAVSPDLNKNNISITNNVSAADVVYVTGLSAGSVVKVYDTSNALIGSATVGAAKTDATVSISQLGTDKGSVNITITQPGEKESSKIPVEYSAEGTSTTPSIDNIVVTNNVGKADTVYINNLSGNDIVRIYDSSIPAKLLGTATVDSLATDATVTIAQLGALEGKVKVAVTSTGMSESNRITVTYKAENPSGGTVEANISVTNNAGKPDTVYITRLSAGDVVKVYDALLGGNSLGSTTVASGETDATITIAQLGTASGNVYVTVASAGTSESKRVMAPYLAEVSSADLSPDQIVVTNNIVGTSDTIYVSGLNTGDVIKAYNAKTKGNRLGTATVAAGETSATISVTQLGAAAGSVYVSVTSVGKQEGGSIEAKYNEEGKSTATTNIKVTNNAGAADTVYVSGLVAEDVVKVYDAAKAGKLLGSATVTTYSSDTTVSIAQLGSTAGKVYVTISSLNKSESDRKEAEYDKEPTSTKPTNITVVNNAGASDAVKVIGLTPGDVVKVYDTEVGGNTLGSATVSANSTDTTVEIAQLGSSKGKIYVTVTSTNKLESERATAEYEAESKPKDLDASQVTIENNSGIASTVTVKGLKDNDLVNVYDAESGGNLLGTGTVAIYNSEVTISVSQLSSTGGKVYISVTSKGKLESDRTPVDYNSKAVSTKLDASSITIENNYGIADTLTITNLDANTVIKVYSTETGGITLGTATVASDSSKATISFTQLGTSGGKVYVTATNTGKTESTRTEVSYTAEGASDALASGNITIVNNSGMADTITITGLELNSIVKIYNAKTEGSKLATATADASTLATTINISQLGTDLGSIYVTVTRPGKSESIRTEVKYAAESTAAAVSNITILNNAGMSDTITVTGLAENDVIKAYDAVSNGNLLGSGVVAIGSNKATITVAQLTKNAGNVYISVTNYGRAESKLTKAGYLVEQSATAPYIGDIHVVNNVDIEDTITVYNLMVGDVILVYNDDMGKDLLGYATVAKNKTEATVSVEDLGTSAGVVYVSVITKGKNESACTGASYVAESKSTAPYSGDIHVTNNVKIADTILISDLTTGDKVKVYNTSTGGDLLGYATVSSSSGQVTVSIPQLGVDSGSVYVSVTSKGKTESNRTKAEYVSEQTTNEPYIGNIDVVNNAGAADKVTIINVSSGDVIKVYDAASDGNLLKSITVAAGSTTGTLSIAQLGTSAGSIYVTVTSTGKAESNRAKVDFNAE